jgi:hypothetical protein
MMRANVSTYSTLSKSGVLGLKLSLIYSRVSCENAPVSKPKYSMTEYILFICRAGVSISSLFFDYTSNNIRPILSNI